MNITIRRATLEDRNTLGRFWAALLEEHAALDPLFSVTEDAPVRWRNDFKEWVPADTRRIFVAEADGEVVGYLSAHPWFPPPIHEQEVEVYVSELYVVPAHRGKGVGKQLMDAVRAWAVSIEAARLRAGLLAANEQARSFWYEQGARDLAVTIVLDVAASKER